MTRGAFLGLDAHQRWARMMYLAQRVKLGELDDHVRKAGAPDTCPDGYYLLKDHNGGKDPTAPDPFDRWTREGAHTVNRTADCIGGMAWAGGFDRFQEKRFDHLYGGWINTDSMLMDATGPCRFFEQLKVPELGCFVVYASGTGGHKVGHIGGVVSAPAEWDATNRDCWKRLSVVDVAARTPGKANAMRTGELWFGIGYFVRVIDGLR